ncbi:hypothetical protein PC116_g21673 [Phytophthora cactorum]|nr:hypothetical protein PC116_g21673 [Phytophthora cactorum]
MNEQLTRTFTASVETVPSGAMLSFIVSDASRSRAQSLDKFLHLTGFILGGW